MKQAIKKILQRTGRLMHPDDSDNLKKRIQSIATHQSAEYILENMPKAKSFLEWPEIAAYALNECKITDGIYVEFGVCTGNTITYFTKISGKPFFGFDWFGGLPEFWRDGFDKGACNVDSIPDVPDTVELKVGLFEDTLPKFCESLKLGQQIAFMHVDCDLYSSTKTIFDNLAPFIGKDTIILFDEYFNFPFWQQGEFKAFKEFCAEYSVDFEYLAYRQDYGQVVVRVLGNQKLGSEDSW